MLRATNKETSKQQPVVQEAEDSNRACTNSSRYKLIMASNKTPTITKVSQTPHKIRQSANLLTLISLAARTKMSSTQTQTPNLMLLSHTLRVPFSDLKSHLPIMVIEAPTSALKMYQWLALLPPRTTFRFGPPRRTLVAPSSHNRKRLSSPTSTLFQTISSANKLARVPMLWSKLACTRNLTKKWL